MQNIATRLHIPLAYLVQQGSDCYYLSCKDRTELESAGLDWTLVEKLPDLVETCARAEARLTVYRQDGEQNVELLKKLRKEGMLVRSRLALMLRNDPAFADSGSALPWFSRNRSTAAIVEDLYTIARTAERFCEKQESVFIDRELITQAYEIHRQLRDARTARTLYEDRYVDYQRERDSIANELKATIDRINRTGQMVFYDSPRSQAYTMTYFREPQKQSSRTTHFNLNQ